MTEVTLKGCLFLKNKRYAGTLSPCLSTSYLSKGRGNNQDARRKSSFLCVGIEQTLFRLMANPLAASLTISYPIVNYNMNKRNMKEGSM
jgi:hypothetical protein